MVVAAAISWCHQNAHAQLLVVLLAACVLLLGAAVGCSMAM